MPCNFNIILLTEKNTLHKDERLTHTKQIDSLFSSGRWLRSEHLRLIYRVDEEQMGFSCKVLFSCPKKLHRRAVKRNLLKRRMREVYRLNKNDFYEKIEHAQSGVVLGFIITTSEVIEYKVVSKEMKKLLAQVVSRLDKKKAQKSSSGRNSELNVHP